MLVGIGGIIICVCVLMHVHVQCPKALAAYSISLVPKKKNLHQITQTCHSIFKLCSSTANRRFIPRIHSHLDHAHMHSRPFPPSQFHMQSRAAEIANICLEKTNVEVKWLCAAAQFWAHLLTCEPLHALPDSETLPTTMLHCKYFILFIIYQLWEN